MTPGCFKKLVQLFKLYQHCLGDEDVFKSFQNMMGKVKRFTASRGEAKEQVEEFEKQLLDAHQKQLEDIRTDKMASGQTYTGNSLDMDVSDGEQEEIDALLAKRAEAKAAKKKGKGKRGRKKKTPVAAMEVTTAQKKKATTTATVQAKQKKKPTRKPRGYVASSSDEDSDVEMAEAPVARRAPARRTRTRGKKKVIQPSSSDSDLSTDDSD
jgi:hypothetical protein